MISKCHYFRFCCSLPLLSYHQSNQPPIPHKHIRIPKHNRPNLAGFYWLAIPATIQPPQVNLLGQGLGAHAVAFSRKQIDYGLFYSHLQFIVWSCQHRIRNTGKQRSARSSLAAGLRLGLDCTLAFIMSIIFVSQI